MKLVYLTIFFKFSGSRYFSKYSTNPKVINTYITNIGMRVLRYQSKLLGV